MMLPGEYVSEHLSLGLRLGRARRRPRHSRAPAVLHHRRHPVVNLSLAESTRRLVDGEWVDRSPNLLGSCDSARRPRT